jgi:hypothetical protein
MNRNGDWCTLALVCHALELATTLGFLHGGKDLSVCVQLGSLLVNWLYEVVASCQFVGIKC